MPMTALNRVVGLGPSTKNYRARLMCELMDSEELDALAFASADYFRFATNFGIDATPAICVVPRNGEPFVILHELSSNHWRFKSEARRVWVTDAFFYSEHPRAPSRAAVTWSDMIVAKLEQAGLQRARIGTDGADLAAIVKLLPGLVVENVERKCQRLRWVKHEEEIALMREACSLADWVQDRYRENIRPGRLVVELDSSMIALMAEEAARRFSEVDLELFSITLAGPVSASPHGIGSSSNLAGARIEAGHGLVSSVFPGIEGLAIENERTWFCGKPSQRQTLLFEAARAANEAACEAAVIGKPVWAIDAAAADVFERAGVAKLICHRTGHGLGLGGHDFPVNMAFNGSPLLERMVFSIEPGIYEFGLGGFRHDDTVVVGNKPQILTTTAKDLRSQTVL